MIDNSLVRGLANEFINDLMPGETFATYDLVDYVIDNYDGPDINETVEGYPHHMKLVRTVTWTQQAAKAAGRIYNFNMPRGFWKAA